jgi:hypothetical protein
MLYLYLQTTQKTKRFDNVYVSYIGAIYYCNQEVPYFEYLINAIDH